MQELPVDVISVCSASGEIRPLRLRVEDEEHFMQRIDIDEVISRKTIPYVGAEAELFLCKASIHGRLRLLQLRYCIRSHCWHIVQKMV